MSLAAAILVLALLLLILVRLSCRSSARPPRAASPRRAADGSLSWGRRMAEWAASQTEHRESGRPGGPAPRGHLGVRIEAEQLRLRMHREIAAAERAAVTDTGTTWEVHVPAFQSLEDTRDETEDGHPVFPPGTQIAELVERASGRPVHPMGWVLAGAGSTLCAVGPDGEVDRYAPAELGWVRVTAGSALALHARALVGHDG